MMNPYLHKKEMQTWPWFISGPLLALIMGLLIYFGKTFGFSSNFRTMCTIGGAAKFSDFFKINIKDHLWNLAFLVGSIIGGFIAYNYMLDSTQIVLGERTISKLTELQFSNIGASFFPYEIFKIGGNIKSVILLTTGGLLIGFGSRYAGGCTSGHAITGLSNLQIPSLIAVIGFFIGGLVMTHFILPIIF